MRTEPIESIVPEMKACKSLLGYFTANIDDNPIVAYIEVKKTDDPNYLEDGISEFYIVKHKSLFDQYLWNIQDLNDFITSSNWAWTYHTANELEEK